MPAAPQSRLRTLARAKINLSLHIGPKRADGYHELQSLVAFAGMGDEVSMRLDTKGPSLQIETAKGLAAPPEGTDNLIMQISTLFSDQFTTMAPAFTLKKHVPMAAGLGGGSADAAAAVRLICQAYDLDPADYTARLAQYGADIPVCLGSATAIMAGIGETIMPIPSLGQIHALLVNPGVALSTRDVFHAFDNAQAARHDWCFDMSTKHQDLMTWALRGRNDLQETAIRLAPIIQSVLHELEAQDNCLLARMSGSGASCFALFDSLEDVKTAHACFRRQHPKWWCQSTRIGDII